MFVLPRGPLSAQMVNASTEGLVHHSTGPSARMVRSWKMVSALMRSPPDAPKELPSTRPVHDASRSRCQVAQRTQLLETDNALRISDLSVAMVAASTPKLNRVLLSKCLSAHPRRSWTITNASTLVSCSVRRAQFSLLATQLAHRAAARSTWPGTERFVSQRRLMASARMGALRSTTGVRSIPILNHTARQTSNWTKLAAFCKAPLDAQKTAIWTEINAPL
jgi:hypothetical protein